MKTPKFLFAAVTAGLLAVLASCASTDTGADAMSDVIPYTSDMCLMTDNKLGSMGDPVRIVYEGRELKFCCAPCVKKFRANPDKYLATLP